MLCSQFLQVVCFRAVDVVFTQFLQVVCFRTVTVSCRILKRNIVFRATIVVYLAFINGDLKL